MGMVAGTRRPGGRGLPATPRAVRTEAPVSRVPTARGVTVRRVGRIRLAATASLGAGRPRRPMVPAGPVMTGPAGAGRVPAFVQARVVTVTDVRAGRRAGAAPAVRDRPRDG